MDETPDILIQRKNWQPIHDGQATGRGVGITGTNFGQHGFRNVQIETMAHLTPPLMGDLLMRRNDEIPARPSCQIAGVKAAKSFPP
jgi:hypothetical protein